MKKDSDKISDEFIVASGMYHIELKEGKSLNFTKVVERLSQILDKKKIAKSLDRLEDFYFIKGSYDKIDDG